MKNNGLLAKHLLLACIITVLQCCPSLASPPSDGPNIDIWYGPVQTFGNLGTSQKWINLLGTVSPADGIASLTYSLNNGPTHPLSIGPDTRRLVAKGDFNVELDALELADGSNHVVITAVDSLGQATTEAVTVVYRRDRIWPLPYTVSWDTISNIQYAAQIIDGRWTVQDGGLRPLSLGYDRAVAIGDLAWSNYEILVQVTIHAIDTTGFQWPSLHPGFGITLRWQGHTAWDDAQPRWGYTPIGASSWYSWRNKNDLSSTWLSLGGEGPTQIAPAMEPLRFAIPYLFKMRVEEGTDGENVYRLKVWDAALAEPSDWQLSYSEDFEDLSGGSVLLVAHHADVSFGDLRIVPLRDSKDQPSLLRSDSFAEQHLDSTLWMFHNPLQDATLSFTGSQATISVPPEESHTVWGTATFPFAYTSPRIMQQANDVNFVIEVKFDSGVADRYQQHGVLIEQDSLNVLRFEFLGDSENTRIFAASFADGIATTRENKVVEAPGVAPLFMRIQRQGNQWTQYYSFDGDRWWSAVSFSHAFTVRQAGIHVGNSKGVAHTVVIDYFRVRSALQDTTPPVIHDIHVVPGDTVAIISWQTDELATSSLAYGSLVDYPQGVLRGDLLLFAHTYALPGLKPDTEYRYTVYVEDRYYNLATTGERVLKTVPDATPPVLKEISVQPSYTEASITWKTNEPARRVVAYGFTSAYELGEVRHDSLFVNHFVSLTGLVPGTIYYYKIVAADRYGNAVSSGEMRFKTRTELPSAYSDSFDAPVLNTALWTFINPVNDAALALTGEQLSIFVPAENEHILWSSETTPFTNTVPRLMQCVPDSDFAIEIKFDSGVGQQFQQQGIIIVQDSTNLLRLEFFSDGANTRLFAAGFHNGLAANLFNNIIGDVSVAPLYLRIQRENDRWTQLYSLDGIDWLTDAHFSRDLQVCQVGIYAGNSRGVAHTSLIDYFYFSDLTTVPVGQVNTQSEIPNAFRLFSNYPNPFNGSTVIEFAIPAGNGTTVPVELTVYDAVGRRVAQLFKKKTAPGYFRVFWNAQSEKYGVVASGIYFAVLRMGDRTQTVKMILTK